VTKSIRHNRISGGNNQLAGRESRSLAGSKCPRVKTRDVGFRYLFKYMHSEVRTY
jgi:hypothetical protein